VNDAQRAEIFKRLRRVNPAPTTELKYQTPFELLVSVILSAQATDKSVNKATAGLFSVANTPEKILNLGLRGLKHHIKTIGLYNTKAANILKTCRLLLERHDGEVPPRARRCRRCRASAARPRTWYSTPPSASRPSRWIPTSSALPTAPG